LKNSQTAYEVKAIENQENTQHPPREKGERGGVDSPQSVGVLQTDSISKEASCSQPSLQPDKTDDLQQGDRVIDVRAQVFEGLWWILMRNGLSMSVENGGNSRGTESW
ncbi:MAG: hypothetical protein ACRDEA_07450, partial [Microcystaceae cyanobacterium]